MLLRAAPRPRPPPPREKDGKSLLWLLSPLLLDPNPIPDDAPIPRPRPRCCGLAEASDSADGFSRPIPPRFEAVPSPRPPRLLFPSRGYASFSEELLPGVNPRPVDADDANPRPVDPSPAADPDSSSLPSLLVLFPNPSPPRLPRPIPPFSPALLAGGGASDCRCCCCLSSLFPTSNNNDFRVPLFGAFLMMISDNGFLDVSATANHSRNFSSLSRRAFISSSSSSSSSSGSSSSSSLSSISISSSSFCRSLDRCVAFSVVASNSNVDGDVFLTRVDFFSFSQPGALSFSSSILSPPSSFFDFSDDASSASPAAAEAEEEALTNANPA
mmetsp:Transcript_21471/g.45381  ORF Transcript_21471/g.45381 Transcript_21471/m.45381 type:complete len:328 (-) Transcript_21471:126-1109(-)